MIHLIKRNIVPILLGLGLLILLLIESRERGDFNIFINASKDLLEGKDIYKIKYHDWYHYYYDVLFALLVSPLKYISLYWANFIWLLLNVFFTYRIWKIILFFLPSELLNAKRTQLFAIVSFFFIFSLWQKNIHLTQMTIFILYLILEGVYQAENKRNIVTGLLIGLGISIKILPIVLIPYFIYRGKMKTALYSLLMTLIILLLPGIIIGYEHHFMLLESRWELINPLNQAHILDVSERSFHSLTSLLSVLLVENAGNSYSLDIKRNIADVHYDTLKLFINLFRLVFIGFTLYFLRSLPFRKSKSKLHTFYELSYILLIIPLIFPHQQHYAFFFVFPAVSYLIYFLFLKYTYCTPPFSFRQKIGVGLSFIMIYFLLNSHFILGEFREIYDHFKTLTYGVILIIPFLAIVTPEKMLSVTKKEC